MIYKTRHQCLICEHVGEITSHDKEDYQEVRVCPKCNGAFVDTWKIAKYPSNNKSVQPITPTINITVSTPCEVSDIVTERLVEQVKEALKGI